MDTYTKGFIKSARKASKLPFLKQAKKDYTPYLWRKYTTSDLRQALSNALRKLTQKLKQRLIARMLLGGPIALPLGALTAAATPTWDLLRLKQLALDLNYTTKASLIPGYDAYSTLKALGIQRDIQGRVLRQAKKSKELMKNKALMKNKEDSKLKDSKLFLLKQASKSYPYKADLGLGILMNVLNLNDLRVLRRAQLLRKPPSIGASFYKSLPIAALAALFSGMGTYMINGRKDLPFAGIMAGVGGLISALHNTIDYAISPSMSVGDAVLRATIEQEELKLKLKPKQQA